MNPPGGERPYQDIVNHLLDLLEQGGRITDRRPGSVVRTLVEAFARELTETYGRIGALYRHGFIDTAEDQALDALVALLDVTRRRGSAAYGVAVFRRDPRVAGAIHIARDTLLTAVSAATDKRVQYRTAAAEILSVGRDEASVSIVADIPQDAADADAFLLGADDLRDLDVLLAVPLAGIAGVRIPEPTALRGSNESDAQLRARTKGLLAAAGGGTAAALRQAILAVPTVSAVELRDQAQDASLRPGELAVVVDGDLSRPDVLAALERAIAEAKAPGIAVRLESIDEQPLRLTLHLLPEQTQPSPDETTRLLGDTERRVRAHCDALEVGEGLVWNRLLAEILAVPGLRDLDLARSKLALLDADGTWQPQAPANLPGQAQRRLLLRAGSDGLRILLGGETPLYVRFSLGVAAAAPANRQALERSLTEAFIDALAAIAAATDPAARALRPADLFATLSAQVADLGGAPESDFALTITDAASGLRAVRGAADAPVALAPHELPVADGEPPLIRWQPAAP